MRQWHWVAWSISGVMGCLLASGASGSTIRELTYFEPSNVATGSSGWTEVLATLTGDEAGCRFYAAYNSDYPNEFVQLKLTDANAGQSVTRTLASEFEFSFDLRIAGLAAGIATAPVTVYLVPPQAEGYPAAAIQRTFAATEGSARYTLNLSEFAPNSGSEFRAGALDDAGLVVEFHLYQAQAAFGIEGNLDVNWIAVDNLVLSEVPEPGSVGMLAVASLAALRRRRR